MKLIRQFGIILAITFAGEVLKGTAAPSIPVSIYGLLLMLVLLITGILPLEAVQDAGKFLIEIMPVLFVPAASVCSTAGRPYRPFCCPSRSSRLSRPSLSWRSPVLPPRLSSVGKGRRNNARYSVDRHLFRGND